MEFEPTISVLERAKNPNFHYCVTKSPLLAYILNQFNPAHNSPSYLITILILSTYLCLRLPSGVFPYDFPNNYCIYVSVLPIRATFPAHQSYSASKLSGTSCEVASKRKENECHWATAYVLHELISSCTFSTQFSKERWVEIIRGYIVNNTGTFGSVTRNCDH
jgi:hypothetical protein